MIILGERTNGDRPRRHPRYEDLPCYAEIGEGASRARWAWYARFVGRRLWVDRTDSRELGLARMVPTTKNAHGSRPTDPAIVDLIRGDRDEPFYVPLVDLWIVEGLDEASALRESPAVDAINTKMSRNRDDAARLRGGPKPLSPAARKRLNDLDIAYIELKQQKLDAREKEKKT